MIFMRRPSSYRMALITGASSGIGQAFAEELPERTGLMLVARREGRLEELAHALGRPGRAVVVVPADLTTDAGRAAVIAQAREQGVDLLINNAGRGQLGRLIDHAPEDERATVELNVTTPLVLTRALLPDMLAAAGAAGRQRSVRFATIARDNRTQVNGRRWRSARAGGRGRSCASGRARRCGCGWRCSGCCRTRSG